jgi:hypothetical protein
VPGHDFLGASPKGNLDFLEKHLKTAKSIEEKHDLEKVSKKSDLSRYLSRICIMDKIG